MQNTRVISYNYISSNQEARGLKLFKYWEIWINRDISLNHPTLLSASNYELGQTNHTLRDH